MYAAAPPPGPPAAADADAARTYTAEECAASTRAGLQSAFENLEAEEARIREVGAAVARQHELHKAEMKQKEDILLFLMTFRLVSWQLAALGARDSPRANTAF